VPHHAGWGRSPRADWMRSVRDLAVMHRGLLAVLGIEKAGLIGLGFGGWIAAEMATMAPRDVAKLVLVGPMGIKPPEGDIFDQAIVSYIDYARAGFHDQKAFDKIYGAEPSTDQLEAWEGLCEELGEEPADVALAWLLQQQAVTAPIIGPRTQEQFQGSLRALEITLDQEALDRLDSIFPGPGGSAPEAYAW